MPDQPGIAKRIQDMGPPAWPTVVALVIVSGVATQFASDNVQQGLSTAEWLALLLIPSGAFGQHENGSD